MISTRYILFADDNPGDLELVREALIASGKGTGLHTASNGEEALQFLRKEFLSSKPLLVLLDLNMPRKDGIETLREIRADTDLKNLPVIIFSSSTAPQDRHLADLHRADDYIIKPALLNEFTAAICAIESTWCPVKMFDSAVSV